MFLEIHYQGLTSIVNSAQISYVSKSFKNDDMIIFMSSGKEIHLSTSSPAECGALIQGFILALNGMDFKEEGGVHCYIKPLKSESNEILYKYMMLKEFIADRK